MSANIYKKRGIIFEKIINSFAEKIHWKEQTFYRIHRNVESYLQIKFCMLYHFRLQKDVFYQERYHKIFRELFVSR